MDAITVRRMSARAEAPPVAAAAPPHGRGPGEREIDDTESSWNSAPTLARASEQYRTEHSARDRNRPMYMNTATSQASGA
jgi:hypothetical protein